MSSAKRLASYFAGLQARDADVHALWGALDDRADTLNVGVPAARRTNVGMGNAVAPRWALATDLAYRCHVILLDRGFPQAQRRLAYG